MTKVTDPKDQDTVYTYDALSRLREVTQARGPDTTVFYDYDDRGRLDTVTNARGDKLVSAYATWGGLESVLYDANKSGGFDQGERIISY